MTCCDERETERERERQRERETQRERDRQGEKEGQAVKKIESWRDIVTETERERENT